MSTTGPWGPSIDEVRVSLPEDRSGFVRRQCRWCKRCFKLRPADEDGEAVRRWASRTISAFSAGPSPPLEALRCPYCAQPGTREDWLTGPHRVGIERFVSCLRGALTYTALHQLVDGPLCRSRPTVVPVAPEPIEGALGAEPDDLRVVALVCCELEVKVVTDWPGVICCPQCGLLHHRPARARDVQLTFVSE